MNRTNQLANLTNAEWDQLQDLLERYETASAKSQVADWASFLPPTGSMLRAIALQELVKADLEISGRRGECATLDTYLQRFPELGTAQTLPPRLIYEEYRFRHLHGDRPPVESYRERFPSQFLEFKQLVQHEPIRQAPPPIPPRPLINPSVPLVVREPGVFQLDSSYRVGRRLARGSFGEVWQAYAPGGVEVALKIVIGNLGCAEAQRELYALNLMKQLRHPFLLPIHAYWQTEDQLIIAMELADRSLRDELASAQAAGARSLPADQLLRYFQEVAEALDYLHEQRVLHRDIKPANILLFRGHAKVADFGLALLVQQSRRLNTSSHCGTPLYTAPEIFWRGKVGSRSDQYSLAITYVECRLGRPLFPDRSWYDLMQAHLNRRPDLAGLGAAEQVVLHRALAKDPDQRHASCGEFVAALRPAIGG